MENQKEILTLIEWPEKIDNKIENKIDLFFEYGEDMNKRFLSIKGLSNEKLNELVKSKLKKIKGDASFRSFYRKKIIKKVQL